MKLGVVSAIYEGYSFEEVIDSVSKNGYACVEVEDKAFEGDRAGVENAVALSYRYMRNFVI